MFRGVAGCVHNLKLDIADFEDIAILEQLMIIALKVLVFPIFIPFIG